MGYKLAATTAIVLQIKTELMPLNFDYFYSPTILLNTSRINEQFQITFQHFPDLYFIPLLPAHSKWAAEKQSCKGLCGGHYGWRYL